MSESEYHAPGILGVDHVVLAAGVPAGTSQHHPGLHGLPNPECLEPRRESLELLCRAGLEDGTKNREGVEVDSNKT